MSDRLQSHLLVVGNGEVTTFYCSRNILLKSLRQSTHYYVSIESYRTRRFKYDMSAVQWTHVLLTPAYIFVESDGAYLHVIYIDIRLFLH